MLASVVGAACGDLTAGGSNETLAPLVPDRTGPPVTQVAAVGPDGNPVVNTQGSTTTLPREQAPAELAADDTDALSVAARFLAAAASGDQATAAALEVAGRSPTVFDWAQRGVRRVHPGRRRPGVGRADVRRPGRPDDRLFVVADRDAADA